MIKERFIFSVEDLIELAKIFILTGQAMVNILNYYCHQQRCGRQIISMGVVEVELTNALTWHVRLCF